MFTNNSQLTPIIHVGVGVIKRSNSYLIGLRSSKGDLPNLWEFPGGKMEPGENIRTCVAREMAEELGITVTVGPLLQVAADISPEKTKIIHFFLIEEFTGEPELRVHQKLRWVTADQFPLFRFPSINRQIFHKL